MGDGSMSIREFARRGGKATAAKRTGDERRDQAAQGGRAAAEKLGTAHYSKLGLKRGENPAPRGTGKKLERALVLRAVTEHEQEVAERTKGGEDGSDVA